MTSIGGTRTIPLADRLSELARQLQDEPDVQSTLDRIVLGARDTVPGAQHASISAVERRRQVRTVASTGPLPTALDQAQYDAQQGPCLDALYERETARVPDVRAEARWPRFLVRARQLRVSSMLAVQLYVRGDDLGALNLSSGQPHAFDDDAEHVALLFAAHAAVAMADAKEQQSLRSALSTRDLVGTAKGMLIERFKVTGEQAFALLVRSSQDSNRKLHDVAAELVETGALPRR
jgi:GAF domain-containing protein